MNARELLSQLSAAGKPVDPGLFAGAKEVSLPSGAVVFHQGDQCNNYLLILQGGVKVLSRAENGREIVLYRLGAGDSCVLTTSCLFGNVPYPAEGITESQVTALALPAAAFRKAIRESEDFRTLVIQTFTDHLAGVIGLLEEVAFGRIDQRLARYLIEHADSDGAIRITHQGLATELGSAREVISRHLKDFEGRGLLTTQRGSLMLHDRAALEKLATG